MDRPQSRGKLFAAVSAALIVVTVGSGCSTLLNPYVRDAKLDRSSWSLGVGVDRLENVIEGAEAQRAAYYSTTNWYLTGPRERIYLAGTLALSCAIHAIEVVGDLRRQVDEQVRDLAEKILKGA